MRIVLLTAFFIPVLATAQNHSPTRCAGDPPPLSTGAGDWNGWGVDTINSRFQPQPGIAAEDVPKLKLKWAFGFPGEVRTQSQAVIVGGRVFVGTTAGTVYSLDAATGCTYWTYEAGAFVKSAITVVPSGNPPHWTAYFGDGRGYVHAVDARTGEPVWKIQVEEHPAARITGSPTYYKGHLYVPVASGEETLQGSSPKYQCCTFRGSLSAIDVKNGRFLWKTFTVPDPAKPYKTNAEGTKLYGPAGAGIWSAPTIDEKHKRIYVGTGNSYTGVNLPTSDAILAFDLESGSLLWSQQVTPGDNWVPGCPKGVNCPENPGDDFDFGSSPVLRPGADGKQVLVAAQKSGVVYGLDPEQRGEDPLEDAHRSRQWHAGRRWLGSGVRRPTSLRGGGRHQSAARHARAVRAEGRRRRLGVEHSIASGSGHTGAGSGGFGDAWCGVLGIVRGTLAGVLD